LGYVAAFAPIREILILLAVVSFTGIPYTVLMPVFAGQVLHGGAHTYGILMAATGVGAIAGVLWLATRTSVLGLGRTLSIAGVLFGLGLIGFGLSHWLWLSLLLLMVAGGGMMVQMAASNTLVQTLVDEDKRGRVMSFYTMAFFGMMPFGSLAAGWLGGKIGAPWTVVAGGVATLAAVALFARRLPMLRREARPVLERLGILPEIAIGLRSATDQVSRPEE
ncbi:MAG: MFS transporter, partial [Polyangia bacterium]